MSNETLVREFDQLLGTKPYFTASQLIEVGLFGSTGAANAAIKRGELTALKISQRRIVIPRSAALDYFQKSLIGNAVQG